MRYEICWHLIYCQSWPAAVTAQSCEEDGEEQEENEEASNPRQQEPGGGGPRSDGDHDVWELGETETRSGGEWRWRRLRGELCELCADFQCDCATGMCHSSNLLKARPTSCPDTPEICSSQVTHKCLRIFFFSEMSELKNVRHKRNRQTHWSKWLKHSRIVE